MLHIVHRGWDCVLHLPDTRYTWLGGAVFVLFCTLMGRQFGSYICTVSHKEGRQQTQGSNFMKCKPVFQKKYFLSQLSNSHISRRTFPMSIFRRLNLISQFESFMPDCITHFVNMAVSGTKYVHKVVWQHMQVVMGSLTITLVQISNVPASYTLTSRYSVVFHRARTVAGHQLVHRHDGQSSTTARTTG